MDQQTNITPTQITRNEKFQGIINAIEFFSQRFDIDQIINYAFEFTKDLLSPNHIALWCLSDDEYKVAYYEGYEQSISFPYQSKYDQIVYFHAGLLYPKDIATHLPEEIGTIYSFDFCIPLVMDKSFLGFIGVKRDSEEFNEDDKTIAASLMNLFTTSLTNYNNLKVLEQSKSQLDEKIFNLFAINQSSRALLSELSLNSLQSLAISVFSELTQSSFTTFFMKDSVSENYKLMSYKNVYHNDLDLEITLYENKENYVELPVVIDMSDEFSRSIFLNLFFNGNEIIEKIDPKYVILLQKSSQLVGFVTLGTKVNDTQYDQSVFELVESLASSTYIAITNAMHIEKIQQQKEVMHRKLQELIKLNELMKNINSANSCDRVLSLVMDTLSVTFDVDMSFFGLYNKKKENVFEIQCRRGISDEAKILPVSNALSPLFNGAPVAIYQEDFLSILYPESFIDCFEKQPMGSILMPVFIKTVEIELIGVFAILKTKSNVLATEENLVSYEAIATHVAPVIHQLLNSERIKATYQPDYSNLFLRQLSEDIDEAKDFSLELYVIHFERGNKLYFDAWSLTDTLRQQFTKVYPVDSRNIFIITNKKDTLELLESDASLNYKVYELGKDYNDLKEFENIFE